MSDAVIVIGAGGLLGSHIVAGLTRLGMKVVAADINPEAASARIEQLGIRVNVKRCDVTSRDAVDVLFAEHPSVCGLVNASYPRNKAYGAKFFDVTVDNFNDNLALHLGSAFSVMQAAAKSFVDNPRKFSFVNIASIYGVVAPKFDIYDGTAMTMPVEYAAIKSAIIHLSRYVSAFVGNSDFRVNVVSPGGVFDNQDEIFLEKYAKKTHGAGMLRPEDFVSTIAFLLGDSSRYVTGQNIIVDDGFTL